MYAYDLVFDLQLKSYFPYSGICIRTTGAGRNRSKYIISCNSLPSTYIRDCRRHCTVHANIDTTNRVESFYNRIYSIIYNS